MTRRLPQARRPRAAALFVALSLLPVGAFAAGFEKATVWSGRYAGMGSAATSIVSGAQATYFNPAGLAGAEQSEISLSFSPTFAKMEGPMPTTSTGPQLSVAGNRKLAPVAGLLASQPLSSRWTVGLGYYVAGGIKSFFDEVDYTAVFPNAQLRPDVKADLEITEWGLGTAYQVLPHLKIGGAWRIVQVNADFSSVKVLPDDVGFQNVFFEEMKATRANGVRLGAQYQAPSGRWGLGTTWRNGVRFTADGRTAGQRDINGTVTQLTPGTASVTNTFPQQVALGGYYNVSPRLTLVAEYAWSEYSKNRVLDVSGSVGGVSLDVAGDIQQQWKDMSNIRLGAEYAAPGAWMLRGGYIYTSQVTPDEHARATFAAPGAGHTLTFGIGRKFMGGCADYNLAAEYSFASGEGSNSSAVPALSENITPGKFKSNAFVLHTGVTYLF